MERYRRYRRARQTRLQDERQLDGAPAGSYEATVTKEITISEDSTEPGGSPTIKSSTRYVDLQYANPNTSGLTAEVKEQDDNQIELKVGEKIEEEIEATGL